MALFKSKSVKLINTTGKTYNGYKPGQTVNVENPERYLLEGWKHASLKPEAESEEENTELNYNKLSREKLATLAQSKNIITAGKKKKDIIKELEALDEYEEENSDGEEEFNEESDPNLKDELE